MTSEEVAQVVIRISGEVIHGVKEPNKPPTINIKPKLPFPGGIFTGHAFDGDKHLGQALIMSHFLTGESMIEAYIGNFHGDLYGKVVTLVNIHRLDRDQLALLADQLLLLLPLSIPPSL